MGNIVINSPLGECRWRSSRGGRPSNGKHVTEIRRTKIYMNFGTGRENENEGVDFGLVDSIYRVHGDVAAAATDPYRKCTVSSASGVSMGAAGELP